MYICVCNAIREDDLRKAARRHSGCSEEVYGAMGFEPQCSQCLSLADRILDEERENRLLGCFVPA